MSRSENWKWPTTTHLAIDNPQPCFRRQAVYMLMFTSLKINDIQIKIDVLFTYQICLFKKTYCPEWIKIKRAFS